MKTDNVPKVAVLLAAYNGMKWIEEQVNSILNQQDVDVSLFISVDLSTDGTDQWVKKLAGKDSRVAMLPYGERFGGAGPNFFRLIRDVDFSGFDAVSFADQDDIWFADKLQRSYSFIETKQCDVYSSNVIAFWPNGKQFLINKAQAQKKFDHFFEAAGPGCTYVFNTESALALKYFLIDRAETINSVALHDWLAYAFCRDRGYVWFIDKEPSLLYRQHANNQVGVNKGLSAYRKRLDMLTSQWYRLQVEAIAEIVNPSVRPMLVNRSFVLKNFINLRRKNRDCFLLFIVAFFNNY